MERAVEAGILEGNPTDIAHVILSVAQGMATVEVAGWVGTSATSIERRWQLAINAVLDGLQSPSRSSRS